MIASFCLFEDGVCLYHGNPRSTPLGATCTTADVLLEVWEERARQFARYGTNNGLRDGTGPDVRWLDGVGLNLDWATADELQERIREEYERFERRAGNPDWLRLVREEVAEAFAESDEKRLQEELIQVAALCVSWVESIRVRSRGTVADGPGVGR